MARKLASARSSSIQRCACAYNTPEVNASDTRTKSSLCAILLVADGFSFTTICHNSLLHSSSRCVIAIIKTCFFVLQVTLLRTHHLKTIFLQWLPHGRRWNIQLQIKIVPSNPKEIFLCFVVKRAYMLERERDKSNKWLSICTVVILCKKQHCYHLSM